MDKMNKQTTAKISSAENGYVLEMCYGDEEGHQDKQYIYPTMEKLVKELTGIFSVAEAEAPEEDEKSLEKMKKTINKEKY